MKIAGKEIGLDSDVFIIAEVGVNYDNSMEYAEELIISAKRAGADAIKFQTYKPSKIVAIDSPKYWEDDNPHETQFEFFTKSNTFYHEEMRELARICEETGISFMSTPFDLESVDLLEELDVPAYKIASADITFHTLLRKVARTNKPVILSTGASSIGEIERAIEVIENEGNSDIVLLHCILAYPTPHNHSHLNMIRSLRDIFPKYEIGWSDHVIPDSSVVVPTVAAVLGASIVEKHFTTDRTRKGNDHFHSLDEELLRVMIENIRLAKSSMGQSLKQCVDIEKPARENARRSIAAANSISKGDTLTEENLIMLRPGTGIQPMFLDQIIGLKAKRDIKAGYLIRWGDIL